MMAPNHARGRRELDGRVAACLLGFSGGMLWHRLKRAGFGGPMNPRIRAAIVAFGVTVCAGCSGAAQTSLTPVQAFAAQSHATRAAAPRVVPGPELYVANSGN